MKDGKIKITHNEKLFFAIILLFILIVFLFVIIRIKEGEAEKCKVDSDCVKQQVTCCSCNMGGREECISKKNVSYWKEKLAEECEQGLLCIALYNCQDTSCRCIEGKCVEE